MNTNVPNWWKTAIAIEYLPCRDYLNGDRLSKFDFQLVTNEQLEKAINTHKIVSYGIIFHNVHPFVIQQRGTLGLFGGVVKPVVEGDSLAIIPNGLVSKFHFPQLTNPIDVCDPIETFNSHIQVLDEGVLYQWEIAKFEGVAGRHYGRWVSDYVDLSKFDNDYDKFQDLIRLKAQSKEDPAAYVNEARKYIENIQSLRSEVFGHLLEVHKELKAKDYKSREKVVNYRPPILSHFETMKIEHGEISTKASMAPVFYRSALKHAASAKKLKSSTEITSVHILDEIHQESAEAIIMAAACLEAVINEIGDAKYSEIWGSLEKLSLGDKFKIAFKLAGKIETYDPSKAPFQLLNRLVLARNEMIHFKPDYKKVKVLNGSSVSRLDMLLDIELIDKLPIALNESICKLHDSLTLAQPAWLSDQVGWKVSGETQQHRNLSN